MCIETVVYVYLIEFIKQLYEDYRLKTEPKAGPERSTMRNKA